MPLHQEARSAKLRDYLDWNVTEEFSK